MLNRNELDVATELTIAAINNKRIGIDVDADGGKKIAALFNAIFDGVIDGVKKHTDLTVS